MMHSVSHRSPLLLPASLLQCGREWMCKKSALFPAQKLQFDTQVSTSLVFAAMPLCPWNITTLARLSGCFDMMGLFLHFFNGTSRLDARWMKTMMSLSSYTKFWLTLWRLACVGLSNLISLCKPDYCVVWSYHHCVLQSRNRHHHHGAQGPYWLILHCHQEVDAGHSPSQ